MEAPDLTNTRSPSLRDLVGPNAQSNGAFMHNGAFATLAQVINHYNAIPADNANLDPRLRRQGGGGVQTSISPCSNAVISLRSANSYRQRRLC